MTTKIKPHQLPMARGSTSDAFDGQNLLIADKACTECLFSKDKLVSEETKREILSDCYKNGSYFICHEATIAGRAVICHNFAKSTNGAGNQAIRVAQFMGVIKYVAPGCPTEESPPKKPRKSPSVPTAASRSRAGGPRPSGGAKRKSGI